MKIEGIFSSDTLNEYPICLDTYGYLGLKYTKNLMEDDDKDMYLFLKKLPSFEEVFSTFMNESVKIFRNNKNLDICLSLFYDPYFDDFYNKIKQCYFQIGARKKKYLIKNMLKYLADDIYYKIIVVMNAYGDMLSNYYIKKDIYAKSKELLRLIDNKNN